MISILVAAAENGVIGMGNKIPWHLPADLKRFATLTKGHKVIMGRKTYESILGYLGKPLPERESIVITRQPDYAAPGTTVVGSLEKAVALIKRQEEAFVIGGAEVYRQAFPLADRIYLTKVHAKPEGDAFFPTLGETEWQLASAEVHQADAQNQLAYTYEIYDRKK